MDETRLTEQEAKWKKKFFPRVPWGENGPVRRMYLVQSLKDGQPDAARALAALAVTFGFCEKTVTGDADVCCEAFARRADTRGSDLIFGTDRAAVWCDAVVTDTPEPGWQRLIVRSEEAENLTALAHEEGALRFRRG